MELQNTVEGQEAPDIEAEFALERPVTCPNCAQRVQDLHVVRLLRTKVNFTSNVPRRGFVIICPNCDSILAATIGTRML